MNFKNGEIEGIVVHSLDKFIDHRGYLIETYRDDYLPEGLKPAMSYVSFTKPMIFRGPHEHILQTDMFVFIGPGIFKIQLWDNRKESKTFAYFMEVIAGEDNPVSIIVPPGVVHAYQNISQELGMVINYPNKLYKGWNKELSVDEVRHEDQKGEFYLDFLVRSKQQ